MSRLSRWLEQHQFKRRWVRGQDSRPRHRRLLELWSGEEGIVHAFGDSHSWALVGGPGLVVHDLPGITMFRVGRDSAWFLRRTRWRRGKRSALLLAFGEIDVRAHVARIAAERGETAATIIEKLVTAYLDAIARNAGPRLVVICAVTPPATNEMAESGHLPVIGTLEERVALSRLMNQTLERESAKRGFVFCDPYAGYSDARGALCAELSDGNVHLDRKASGPMLAAVQALLADARASTGMGAKAPLRPAPFPRPPIDSRRPATDSPGNPNGPSLL